MRVAGGSGPHGLAQAMRRNLSVSPFQNDTIQWGIVAGVHGSTNTTLTSAASVGDGTLASPLYMAAAPLVNDLLVIGPAPSPSPAPRVTSVTGTSSPYSVTITPNLTIAQASGATVTALPTLDVYLNGAQNPTPASALTWGVRYFYGSQAPSVGQTIPFMRGIGGLQTDRFGLGMGGALPTWLMSGSGSPIAGSITPTQTGAVYFDLTNGAIFEAVQSTNYVGASAGTDVSTFVGSTSLQTQNPISGFPSSGSFTVATSGGTASLTYSGIGTSPAQFNNCTTIAGSGTLSTAGLITLTTLSPSQWVVVGGLDTQDSDPIGVSSPDGDAQRVVTATTFGIISPAGSWVFQADAGMLFPLADSLGAEGGAVYFASTTPSGSIGGAGDWCFTQDGNLYYNDAGTWTLIAPGGGGFTNPMTTEGDMIYENATPAPARLPIGASGDLLTVVSGVPTWVAPPSTPIGAILGTATISGGVIDIPAGNNATVCSLSITTVSGTYGVIVVDVIVGMTTSFTTETWIISLSGGFTDVFGAGPFLIAPGAVVLNAGVSVKFWAMVQWTSNTPTITLTGTNNTSNSGGVEVDVYAAQALGAFGTA